jgi:hypothetical protein
MRRLARQRRWQCQISSSSNRPRHTRPSQFARRWRRRRRICTAHTSTSSLRTIAERKGRRRMGKQRMWQLGRALRRAVLTACRMRPPSRRLRHEGRPTRTLPQWVTPHQAATLTVTICTAPCRHTKPSLPASKQETSERRPRLLLLLLGFFGVRHGSASESVCLFVFLIVFSTPPSGVALLVCLAIKCS